MQTESRVKKTLLNARVNFFYYFLFLIISFYTRKIFLTKLGTDFVGLSSTIGNLLGMLNIVELGIGSSVAMTLYKPVYDKDRERINDVVSVLGYLYSKVGMVVLGGGVILSAFIPLIFAHTIFEYAVIYAMFFSMLTSSLIGYFINYRQFLLNADQKGYEVTRYSQAVMVVKTLLQAGVAYYSANYYYWIAIEFVFGIAFAVILNWRIRKIYPWLRANIARGKVAYPQNKDITKKARQVFIHGFAGSVRYKILPFLMYSFSSLHTVALYLNYTLVADKINSLLGNFLSSTGAGIGNLVAEGNIGKIMKVFWEMMALKFALAVFVTYALAVLINPFITIWLGVEYVIDDVTIALLLLINFLGLMFDNLVQFRIAYNLVQDVWAPIATIVIMLPLAVVGGHLWGLPGVLMGNAASAIMILAIWHPYMLFHNGFKRSVTEYWKNYARYIAVGLVAMAISGATAKYMPYHECTNFAEWAIYSVCACTTFLAVFLPMMYFFCEGTRDFAERIMGMIKSRRTK